MHRPLLVLGVVCCMTLTTVAQDQTQPAGSAENAGPKVPIGYFLGVSMGQQLKNQGLQAGDVDLDNLRQGLEDALSGKELNLSDDQLREVAERFQKLVNNRFGERMDQKKAEGQAWLKQNLQKEGVKELAGGLQYKVLEEGDGPSPSPSDNVRVHYTGKLLNGKVFDSSVKRGEPAEFVVGQVIKGWQMALQQMQVGDKWMLYIPPELAYGERGSRPAIGPNEVLVFEVELLEIL